MDIIDHAQELDQKFQDDALKVHFMRRESTNQAIRGHDGIMSPNCPSGRLCLDCGEEIPPARIEANPDAVRCVDCQSKKERK